MENLILTKPELARLFGKITLDEASGCWIWGGTSPWNYGQARIRNKKYRMHRLLYEAWVGRIPDGLQLDHLCRNTRCCNPAHMEPVTARENLMRSTNHVARNHLKTHCPKGHEYTPENTVKSRTGRACRACKNDWLRRHDYGHANRRKAARVH